MSTCISRDVGCPQCGAISKRQMWIGIGVSANPELRRKILNETLFDWKCPECGYRAQMEYPTLYHDKERQIMICLLPNGDLSSVENMADGYSQLSQVKKRLVTSLAALKEKILIFESGLNDIGVELVKLALSELVEKKKGTKVEDGFFSMADDSLDVIRFYYFVEGSNQPFRQGTKLDVYHKSLELVESTGFSEKNGFLQVDSALAQKILEEYQEE